jgi:hypothetical protein
VAKLCDAFRHGDILHFPNFTGFLLSSFVPTYLAGHMSLLLLSAHFSIKPLDSSSILKRAVE